MTLRPATPEREQQPRRPQPPPPSAWDAILERCCWRALRDEVRGVALMWAELATAAHEGFELPPLVPMLLRIVTRVRVDAALIASTELILDPGMPRCDLIDGKYASLPLSVIRTHFPFVKELKLMVANLPPHDRLCLGDFRCLRTLALTGWDDVLRGVFDFSGASHVTTIELLDVEVCYRQLAALPALINLTLAGRVLRDFQPLGESTSLTTLNIRACDQLADDATLGLERIPTLTALCFFDTWCNGVGHLKLSRSLRTFRAPYLERQFEKRLRGLPVTSLTLLGVAGLAWLPMIPAITELDIRDCSAWHLSPVFALEQLRRLKFSCSTSFVVLTSPVAWRCSQLKQVETDSIDIIERAASMLTHLSALVQPDQLGAMNSWTTRGRSRLVDALYRAQRLTHLTLLCDHKLYSRPTECLRAVASCTLLRRLKLRLDHVIDLNHFGTNLVHLEELILSSRTLKGELAVLPSLSRFMWICFGQDSGHGLEFVSEDDISTDDEEDDEAELTEACDERQPRFPRRPLVRGACDAVLQSLAKQPSLTHIKLACSVQITSIAPLQHCPALRHLDVSMCESLADIDGLDCIPTLKTLDLMYCRAVGRISHLSNCPSLQSVIVP